MVATPDAAPFAVIVAKPLLTQVDENVTVVAVVYSALFW
jgi:hypothetical protein